MRVTSLIYHRSGSCPAISCLYEKLAKILFFIVNNQYCPQSHESRTHTHCWREWEGLTSGLLAPGFVSLTVPRVVLLPIPGLPASPDSQPVFPQCDCPWTSPSSLEASPSPPMPPKRINSPIPPISPYFLLSQDHWQWSYPFPWWKAHIPSICHWTFPKIPLGQATPIYFTSPLKQLHFG